MARGWFSPARLAGAAAGLIVLTAVALYIAPSNDFILLPDPAQPVAPLVHVQGGTDPRGPGGIYFVDVFERRANMLESLLPFIRSGATLVPANLIVIAVAGVLNFGLADRVAFRAALSSGDADADPAPHGA